MKNHEKPWKTNLEPWKTMKTHLEPWQPNLEPWKTMKTDLEVEVQVDLRQLGKVLIFRDKQNLPIIYRLQIYLHIRWFLGQTFWCYTVHLWSQRAVRQLTLYLTFSTSSRTFGGSGAWPLLILTTSRWLCLSEVYFTKFFFRGNLGGFWKVPMMKVL